MSEMVYPHRIEYFRRQPDGSLCCEHVETAHDHGWYLCGEPEWRIRYTLASAADFLERVAARAGVYSIVVWQGKRRVCAVALNWDPAQVGHPNE